MQSLLEKKARLVEENPFYRMNGLLNMVSQLPKASDSISKQEVHRYLTSAWAECTSKEHRECFFVILFSLGDIQNREHNIFKKIGLKDVDNGGNSKRKVFAYCLEWILSKVPEQFYRFMPIFGEYYSLDVFRMYHLVTDRLKGTIKEVFKLPIDVDKVTSFIAATLRNVRTTDNEKALWARWLPHVPSGKRIRKYTITEKNIKAFEKNAHKVKLGDVVPVKKNKQSQTNTKDAWVNEFIMMLSTKMSWQVVKHASNTEFRGYKKFRSNYLDRSEAAMFSSQRIKDLDETQLLEWFNQLPSGARFRVACRLIYKDSSGKQVTKGKWVNKFGADLGNIYIKWLGMKEQAQQKVRSLTEEQKKEMNPLELKQLQKAAKVNTGAEGLMDVFCEILTNPREADLKAQSLLDLIKIEVPCRICVDISGSMRSHSILYKGKRFTASDLTKLAATTFLLKSPEEELSEMFIRFESNADVICVESTATKAGANRFMANSSTTINHLVDKTKPFSWNLNNVSQYIISRGGTDLSSIARKLKVWVGEGGEAFKSQRVEAINKYPVWLIISDGDINNSHNVVASIQQFQNDMRQYFGWEGVLVMWDICEAHELVERKYEGVNNFMHLAGVNPGTLNQVFKNIHDLDIVDQYLPLKTLHASNRYKPVVDLVS